MSFVGRDAELGELERHRELVRSGRPRLLVVEGPAGIGKTALVNAFVDQAAGFQVVRASGDESEVELAYGVVDQLTRMAGATAPEVLAQAKLSPSRDDHVNVGLGVLQLLGGLQDDGPVLVVVDDAHWADLPSLRALLFATRRLVADAVLVVMVVRDEDAGRLPDGLRRLADGNLGARLRLGPLAAGALRELAAERGVEISRRMARRLREHTAGSPLHARALLAELPSDAWHDAERPLPAPRTFADLVARRLAGCPPAARRLAEAAAVLSGHGPLATVAALAEVDEPFTALEDAMAVDLLRATATGQGSEVGFTHPLIEAAVYDGLGAARRAQLHAEAAGLADDERHALRHRVAASPGGDAELGRMLEAYATRETARGAWGTAAEAFLSASRVSARPDDRARRLLDAMDAFVFAGDVERARVLAEEARALPAGARRDAALGHVAQFAASPAEAQALFQSAWAQCDPPREPLLAAAIARGLAMHAMLRLDGDRAVTWARRAVELAPAQPSAAPVAAGVPSLAAGVLAFGLWFQGRWADAEQALRAARAGLPSDNGLPLDAQLGWLLLARDDVAGARALLAAATPAAVRLGSHDIAAMTYATRARADFAAGRWEEAAANAERAVAIVADFEHLSVKYLVRWAAVLVPAARGDWAAVDEHVRAVTRHPLLSEEAMLVGGLTVALAAAARQQHDDVLAALEPVVRLEPRDGVDEPGLWPWQDVYADALIGAGRLDDAAAFLPGHEERAAARGLRTAQQRLARSRARLEAARARPTAAAAAFRAALEHADQVDLPFERALTGYAYGQFLRRRGQRRAAAELLRSAHATFVALEAAPAAERCARELEACGLAPAKRGAMGREDLTPQERSVARLVASGLANREVAAELLVSVKTVEVHLTRIYAKLGVKSRAQLAVHVRGAADGVSAS